MGFFMVFKSWDIRLGGGSVNASPGSVAMGGGHGRMVEGLAQLPQQGGGRDRRVTFEA